MSTTGAPPAAGRGITRELLERDGIRSALQAQHPEVATWSNEALRSSLQTCLAARPAGIDLDHGVWVFAYGSLLWNPCIEVADRRAARLYGFHRDFRLRLTYGRGTPATPGLMLGLVPGGSCRGVALQVPADGLTYELELIWRREMLTGGYMPRWLRLQTAVGAVSAITFVVDRNHPCYCERLDPERQAELMARAEGVLGSSAHYLESTVAHLDELGIHDRRLADLRARVRRLHRVADRRHC